MRACAEVDRLTADGGHLIVGDFLPDAPQRRVYHHADDAGIFTYKQDYARIFAASNLYTPIGRLTFDATTKDAPSSAAVPPDNRGACTLLRKSYTDGYPAV